MDDVLKTTDYVTCPYDPNHRMRYSKFHNHFIKCKAAHPEDPREQCPFYASELIHPDNMKDHLMTCKYKNLYSNNYYDYNDTSLPNYDAPCHFNFDEESDNDSEYAETVITMRDRDDDRSSLFSATTRSYRSNSRYSQPIGKIQKNRYYDTKSETGSRAFEYIEDDDDSEVFGADSGNNSWRSSKENGESSSNPSPPNKSTCLVYESSTPFKDSSLLNSSIPNSSASPLRASIEKKTGLGRGKFIQKLLSSSSASSGDNDNSFRGSGRGAWFHARMNAT